MRSKHKTFILIALMLFCFVVFGVVRAEDGDNNNQGNQEDGKIQEMSYLEQLQQKLVSARLAAKEKISKDIITEYETILAWLKTCQSPFPFEEDATEVLAIELLSEVRWFGALDFFIQNIVWHVRFPGAGNEFRPKWVCFPCAMALMKFEGCELKIAKAALSAKRDIETQLLCIVLILMTNKVDAEKILVFCAGDEKESQLRLKEVQTFIKGYDRFKWDPYDCEDFDDPFSPKKAVEKPNNDSTPAPPASGDSALSEENNTTLPASNDTPLAREGSAHSSPASASSRPAGTSNVVSPASDTGQPLATSTGGPYEPAERREGAVAEAGPFPWAIVIVIAIAALSLGAIATLLLTRAKK